MVAEEQSLFFVVLLYEALPLLVGIAGGIQMVEKQPRWAWSRSTSEAFVQEALDPPDDQLGVLDQRVVCPARHREGFALRHVPLEHSAD